MLQHVHRMIPYHLRLEDSMHQLDTQRLHRQELAHHNSFSWPEKHKTKSYKSRTSLTKHMHDHATSAVQATAHSRFSLGGPCKTLKFDKPLHLTTTINADFVLHRGVTLNSSQ